MIDHETRAKDLFKGGYNCAQAVFCSFCDETGLDFNAAARLASSFGGGIGRLREVCGAVSGMCLAAGVLYGYDDPTDTAKKAEHYKRIQQLANEFKKKNGSIICRELLGIEQNNTSPIPESRTSEYYKKRPCAELVGDCAKILEDYLIKNPPENS